jgi:hypothetical protein
MNDTNMSNHPLRACADSWQGYMQDIDNRRFVCVWC